MSWVTTTYTTTTYRWVSHPAWNAGARTVAYFLGDGGFTFTVGQATGIVCGLNDVDAGAGYSEIDHAFSIEPGRFKIIERGVTKTSWFSYAPTDIFKVERILGVVRYYKNTTLVYTSLTPSYSKVFLDCSLYSINDEICDVAVFDYQTESGGVATVSSGTTTITGGTTTAGGGAAVITGGTATITGGTTTASGGVTTTSGGTTTVTGGSSVITGGTTTASGGTTTSTGGTVSVVGTTITITGGTTVVTGGTTVSPDGTVTVTGGTTTITGGATVIVGGTVTIVGNVVTVVGGTTTVTGGTATNAGGTATITGGTTTIAGGVTTVINSGTKLSPLTAYGITDTAVILASADLAPLTASAVVTDVNTVDINLSKLVAFGAVDAINKGTCSLSPLTAYGTSEVFEVPEYNIVDADLRALQVYGLQYDPSPATVDSALSKLTAFGADQAVALIDSDLKPLITTVALDSPRYLVATWPSWQVHIVQTVDNVYSAMTLPEMTLSATGFTDSCTAALTLPTPLLTTRLGAKAQLNLPTLELTTTTTSEGFATVQLTLPVPTLASTALSGEVARGSLILPALELTARTGAAAPLTLPTLTLASQATYVDVARIALTLPLLSLQATGERHGQATVYLELPALTLTAGPSRAELTLPMLVLSSVATVEDTTDGTTWAINITSGAATQLLLGQFDQLVTAHGRLYGRQGTTLVCLDGGVDGVDTPIPITVRFAPQTFGTHQLKRMSDVYLSTREYEGLTLSVITDETTTWDYQTATDNAPAYGTHKVKVGRGTAFHTAGLLLKNRDGGVLDVGGLELLVTPLSRKV